VSFNNANSVVTTASFSTSGTYVLSLTASDSEFTISDEVTIIVNPATSTNRAPVVNAGPDQTITLPTNSVRLNGEVSDDGLPTGSTLTISWSKVSGAGTVTFSNASAAVTTATFDASGTYVLRLTATDSSLTSSDDVTIIVNTAPNPPPTVSITSPVDGASITDRVDVIGSVSNGNWKLE